MGNEELTLDDLKQLRTIEIKNAWYDESDWSSILPALFELAEEAIKARNEKKKALEQMIKMVGYQEDYDEDYAPLTLERGQLDFDFDDEEEGE